jgi:undecaprenyl-diphosphatase
MPLLFAVLLGIVEGLTEFLPVSSTGHLEIADRLLGSHASPSFEIVIQLGAILAVVIHYRKLLVDRAVGILRGDPVAIRLGVALIVAFLPIAVLGLLLRSTIKAYLFGNLVAVAGALIVGGVVMIAVDRVVEARRAGRGTGRATGRGTERTGEPLDGLEHVTPQRALLIGMGQCAALWPGTSRSMSTIVTAQLAGLSTATAAEFSFLLALPALGSATVFEGIKARHELLAGSGGAALAVGLVVSFFVAWAALATFLSYVKRHGMAPCGIYRIILGVAILAFLR